MVAAVARPIQSEISWDPEQHRQYTSTYMVLTDDKNDGPITAIQASGIPAYRSPYAFGNDTDPWAFCSSIQARLTKVEDTARQWTVTVTHSTRPAERCADFQIDNPLDEPFKISGSFAQFTRPATVDRNGLSITNSVQEPFVPAIEIDDSRKVLVIEKNLPTIDLDDWADYADTVNSGTLWGLSSRKIKLNQWRFTVLYYGVCNYYVNNVWEFHINKDKWNHKVIDAGFRHLDGGAAPNYKTIMDTVDQPRHQPTPLDGSGNILDLTGGLPPYTFNFEIYREKDFTAIGLPAVLPGPFV